MQHIREIMENSKQYLKSHQILPRISFRDGTEHIVQLIQDKIDSITDNTGQVKEGVKYKVMEDGEVKTFFTSSQSLISKLAEMAEQTTVSIQMKKKKADDGTFRSYFEVAICEIPKAEPPETKDKDIPVIEDESKPEVPPEASDF